MAVAYFYLFPASVVLSESFSHTIAFIILRTNHKCCMKNFQFCILDSMLYLVTEKDDDIREWQHKNWTNIHISSPPITLNTKWLYWRVFGNSFEIVKLGLSYSKVTVY